MIPSAFITAFVACVLGAAEPRLDRRTADSVEVADPVSEAMHGYTGHDVVIGTVNGQSYRQARGWMRYALTTFDDTEVTVALTFVAADSLPHSYDIAVEDSVVATRTLTVQGNVPVVIQIPVPFAITKGRANIAIIIRAHGGLTPALREVRTVQDHNEADQQGSLQARQEPAQRRRQQLDQLQK